MSEENTWLSRRTPLLPLYSLVRLGGTGEILGKRKSETCCLKEEAFRERNVRIQETSEENEWANAVRNHRMSNKKALRKKAKGNDEGRLRKSGESVTAGRGEAERLRMGLIVSPERGNAAERDVRS
ncbi:hypothetical protein E2C01_001691 [Portunus trituberculatus]|uniref:Uncharacterized protein n=1 Tax=Portunus trituberculatus TaxID=210409 RepID=A0A5B7CIP2_PORTR|nr:hypothetical protein [Portunus trituberculatus]